MANNTTTVDVDIKKAIEAINLLELETENLVIAKKSLIDVQTRSEAQYGKESKQYIKVTQLIKENKDATKSNKKAIEEQISKLNIANLSYNQLSKLLPKLKGQFHAVNKETESERWNRLGKAVSEAEQRLKIIGGRADEVKKKLSFKESLASGIKQFAAGFTIANVAMQAVGKVGEFIAGAWDRAKSVQTEAAKAARVFGSELGYVEMQADKVAARAGLTNKEFIAMATNTADLLVPMGFTRRAAAEMSVDMQKLTGALVEWSNGKFTAEDVSMRLTKAMMGETEGLKELGIGIRKDSEEYKNLVKEKEKGEGVTKAQAEALATLDLVMAKSVDAQTEYTEGGSALMKMGRSINLMWRSMTENVANWIATSNDDRTLEQARKVRSLNDEFTTAKDKIDDLLPRYEELKSKSHLSAEEHAELNRIVKEITIIVPSAESAWDKEGKAIAINTDVVRANMSARNALIKVQNSDLITDLSGKIKTNVNLIRGYKKQISELSALRERNGDLYQYGKRGDVQSRSDDIQVLQYNIKGLLNPTYTMIEAAKGLNLSLSELAEITGLQTFQIEDVYNVKDKEVNPTNYNEDGSKKTAKQLATEEAERLKKQKEDDEKEANKQKAKDAAEDAAKDAKKQREIDAEQKKKDAEKAIEDQKKLEQDIKDAAIALSGDESKIEQDRYDKKLQAFKLYGVEKSAMNADQLAAMEGLEREHQNNIDKIEDSAVASFLSKNDKQFNRELTDLKIQQAEEIAAFKGTKEEKEKLEKKHQAKLKEFSAKGLEDTIQSITTLLSGKNLTGLSEMVLSDEQKAELDTKLADVKLKLADLKAGTGNEDETEEKNPFEIDGSSTDVLGMTPDTWGKLQENLKNGKVGIGEMVAVAKALSAAFGIYNEMATANEKRQLADFEKQNEQKKDILKRRLESGAISQEEYNAQVASLDEELDAKKQEMEIKQAKRDKVQAVFDIAIATAVGIASAMKTIWLVPIIAALGAAQIAAVLATPLPGKEKGGFIAEREDGKKFNAEYAPTKRGYITRPTVITGENGNEYVIPADGLRNPSIASVVSMIENARIKGNIRNVDIHPTQNLQGREQGGFIGSNTSLMHRAPKDDTSVVLARVATALEKLESGGVKASIPLMGDGGIIQQLDKVFKIQKRTRI